MAQDFLEVERDDSFPDLYDLEISPLKEDPSIPVNSFKWIRQNPGAKVLTVESDDGEIRHYTHGPREGEARYKYVMNPPHKLPKHVVLMTDTKMERQVIAKASTKSIGGTWMEFGSIVPEAHNAAVSPHDNIAIIHDLATDGRELFMITEYLPNGTLAEWLKDNHNLKEISNIVKGISDGLEHINTVRKLVYADMKPLNIGFDEEWRPKIIDFELAVKIDEDGHASGNGKKSEYFAAPEQFLENQSLSVKTDVYSLAATVFAIFIDGDIPGMDVKELREMFTKDQESPVPLRHEYNKLLSTKQKYSISKVLHKALQENLNDRYSSVKEFNEHFQAALN
jgi:serine/threonine protein kinase